MVLLIHSREGGYGDLGWDADSGASVSEVQDREEVPESEDAETTDDSPAELAGRGWVTLTEHTQAVVHMAETLLEALSDLALPENLAEAVVHAARWHDLGKGHGKFQETLLATLEPEERQAHAAAQWAKSGSKKRARHSRRYFRHELASALGLLQQGDGIKVRVPHLNLVAYLVAAHHGKVRLAIRSLPGEARPEGVPGGRSALGIHDGDLLPQVCLNQSLVTEPIKLDLSFMELGGLEDDAPSWLQRTLPLRDSPAIGPFRLAFLEAILRAADARASKTHEEGGMIP
jgi:CRISPR-associated endonuclease/helicase Cas3